MSFHMCPQMARLTRCIVALVAFVRFFSRMNSQMSPQSTSPNRRIVALATFVHFFPKMSFQVCLQIVRPSRCIVALVAFERFHSFNRRSVHVGSELFTARFLPLIIFNWFKTFTFPGLKLIIILEP